MCTSLAISFQEMSKFFYKTKKFSDTLRQKNNVVYFVETSFSQKKVLLQKNGTSHTSREKGKNHGYIFFSLSLGKMSMPFLNCVSGMVLSNDSVCPVKAFKSDVTFRLINVTPLLFESSFLSSGFAHHHYHLPNEASLDHSEASVYLFLFT